MELYEAIFQRRSIKEFRAAPVPLDLLERVLTAGVWAQNHKLTEPWHFTVLGTESRQRLATAYAAAQAAAIAEADLAQRELVSEQATRKLLSKPCVLAVSQRLNGAPAQRREDYAAIACAIQNIQLAAWAEGLGMQWSSGKIIALPQTYEILGIAPASEEIVGLLFIGYPAQVPVAQPRKPLAEVLTILP